MVRVRFAPSPTGHLHIGGVRTALFNWLFARANKGKLILRVEDTDLKRSNKKFFDEILDSLLWLGLKWDEGPLLQTERLELYKKYTKELLSKGKAYKSEGAIRFKAPAERVKIKDLVHGDIEFDNSLLDDFVIQKSDGFPTYNFACCVDDYEMRITHVIRGDDHISNTPKQLAIYKALGFTHPKFAHIPLITGEDRTRLSKRLGAAAIGYYREEGYLSVALVNFLALLGWSPGEDLEIMNVDEMISKFSLEGVGKTSSVFNQDKLKWMNHQYIKALPVDKLVELATPFLKAKGYIKENPDLGFLRRVAGLFQDRAKTLLEFVELTDYIFLERLKVSGSAKEMLLKNTKVPDMFDELIRQLSPLDSFDTGSIEEKLRGLASSLNIKAGELIHPVRAALTGRTVSPGLFELMELMGREKVVLRLGEARKKIKGWR